MNSNQLKIAIKHAKEVLRLALLEVAMSKDDLKTLEADLEIQLKKEGKDYEIDPRGS